MTRKKYCGTAAKAGGNGENKPHPSVMGVPYLLTKRLIWVVCIDRSGSMSQGFSEQPEGAPQFQGRSETTSKRVKIDAARETVLREIAGLDPSSDVAILTFSETTEVIFKGTAGDTQAITHAVTAIQTGGNTDIGQCLLECVKFADEFPRTDCLVVTDGLSNRGDPIAAARECNNRGIFINVALINPTPEGEEYARGIARGGRVYAVKSEPELEEGLGIEGLRHQLHRERQERAAFQSSVSDALEMLRASTAETQRHFISYERFFKESSHDVESRVARLSESAGMVEQAVTELRTDVRPLLQAFTLGMAVDEAPLKRYVPVRAYLREGSGRSVEGITSAVDNLLEGLAFGIAEDLPHEKGSWFKRWTAKSWEFLTRREVQERLAKVEQALELQTLDAPLAKVARELAGGVSELINAIKNEPEAALQVGPILVVKTRANGGDSRIQVRTLSPKQLAILERNPDYLKEPSCVLSRLVSEGGDGERPKRRKARRELEGKE